MTRDEYIKSLKKWEDYSTQINHDYGSGYSVALRDAISLAEKLDEPEKVIIPQFADDWIKNLIKYYGDGAQPLKIIFGISTYIGTEDPHYEWLKNEQNQKLLLNAIANGYEVEKEPKYYVKIKHFDSNDDALYVNHSNAYGGFFLDNKKQSASFNTIFTKSYLKHHWTGYEAYNNAGLLEFEEVEDDE